VVWDPTMVQETLKSRRLKATPFCLYSLSCRQVMFSEIASHPPASLFTRTGDMRLLARLRSYKAGTLLHARIGMQSL
jgi:hypothetical protein